MENDLNSAYILHILEAINRIRMFMEGVDWELFQQDAKTQSAVMRQLEIIGEASKNLTKDFKRSVDLPWEDIAGMRDKLIHHYVEVDLKEVWNTIERDLNQLENELEKQNNRLK